MLTLISPLSILIFPLCLAAAVISDVRRYIIPNEISVLLIIGFGAAFAASGLGWDLFLMHLGVGAAMLVAGFALFAFNLCGAGDSKLLAAAALWLGPQFGEALLLIALVGGALALAIIAIRMLCTWFPQVLGLVPGFVVLMRGKLKDVPAPYGVAIAGGSLIAFVDSPIWLAYIGG